MEKQIAQTVPYALDAESALLGGILLDNSAIYATHTLRVSDFSPPSSLILASMRSLSSAGKKIDTVTLIEELERDGSFVKAGGAPAIGTLAACVPLAGAAIAEYVGIIRERAIARALLVTAHNISARVLLGNEDSGALVASANTQLYEVSGRQLSDGGGPEHIRDIVAKLTGRLEKQVGTQGIVLGKETGFKFYDALTGGWQPGQLVTLAARPSVGKSALALDFMKNLALRGLTVGMFNLEMDKTSLVLRLAIRMSSIDSERLRFGTLTGTEMETLIKTLELMKQWEMWIDDTPGQEIEQLRFRMRNLAQMAGTVLQVVDHMQLIRANAENRTQEVTKISGGLQVAAREIGNICGGTVLALSQLGRIGPHEEPQLHNLRESGSIEQDSDVVVFLWDEKGEVAKENGGKKEIRIKIAKQRNGPTGTSQLLFFPERAGFEEADSRLQAEE